MTKEQAIQVIENIVNAGVQKGLFVNSGDVLTAMEAVSTLKGLGPVSFDKYVSIQTSEIKDKQNVDS